VPWIIHGPPSSIRSAHHRALGCFSCLAGVPVSHAIADADAIAVSDKHAHRDPFYDAFVVVHALAVTDIELDAEPVCFDFLFADTDALRVVHGVADFDSVAVPFADPVDF
jgi:hypothetical protein